jgi:hypothetical protein
MIDMDDERTARSIITGGNFETAKAAARGLADYREWLLEALDQQDRDKVRSTLRGFQQMLGMVELSVFGVEAPKGETVTVVNAPARPPKRIIKRQAKRPPKRKKRR